MNTFDVLSDPVCRMILELISIREHASGEIVKVVEAEFGISQSAVPQPLRILRDTGFAKVRKDGVKEQSPITLPPALRQLNPGN